MATSSKTVPKPPERRGPLDCLDSKQQGPPARCPTPQRVLWHSSSPSLPHRVRNPHSQGTCSQTPGLPPRLHSSTWTLAFSEARASPQIILWRGGVDLTPGLRRGQGSCAGLWLAGRAAYMHARALHGMREAQEGNRWGHTESRRWGPGPSLPVTTSQHTTQS